MDDSLLIEADDCNHLFAHHQEQKSQAKRLIQDISQFFIERINEAQLHSIKAACRLSYQQLRLVDESGHWHRSLPEQFHSILSVDDLEKEELVIFLNDTVSAVSKNPYLLEFLKVLPESSRVFAERFSHEGGDLVPKLVSYGFVLNKLTRLMLEDRLFLECCFELWSEVVGEIGIRPELGLFDYAKIKSVTRPVASLIRFRRSGHLPKNFGKFLIPLNIAEACALDFVLGNKNNAKAGMKLITETGKRQPQGFAEWSSDGKNINFNFPDPKQWADLYISWNCAFVSSYGHFVINLVKLLIPQVSNYADAPEKFLQCRLISLYIHLHYRFLPWINEEMNAFGSINIKDAETTRAWGEINRIIAKHQYQV